MKSMIELDCGLECHKHLLCAGNIQYMRFRRVYEFYNFNIHQTSTKMKKSPRCIFVMLFVYLNISITIEFNLVV